MSEAIRVLLVDDEPSVTTVLKGILRQEGIESEAVTSGELGLRALQASVFDAVVTDLNMPGMDGMELLRRVKDSHPNIPVIVLTAHGTIKRAVQAMRDGAYDFLTKPFDRDDILWVIRRAAKACHVLEADTSAMTTLGKVPIVAHSPAMQEVLGIVRKLARTDTTVLVRGESGVGKEVVARAIHEASLRHDGPFWKVHCAGFAETLLEDELFGHEKGAFTGASQQKPGRFELADGGTIFLDEIGDLGSSIQVKLLRVLQDKKFERVGGTKTLESDVRIITATHRDLDQMVADGSFRDDLLFRINVFTVWVPPLRERVGDITPLAEHFLAELSKRHGVDGLQLTAPARNALLEHPWPGNAREVANVMERLVVLAEGAEISADAIRAQLRPQGLAHAGAGTPGAGTRAGAGATASQDGTGARPPRSGDTPGLRDRTREAECAAIEEALERARGNRTLAARLLGISRRTLYNKLAEYEIR